MIAILVVVVVVALAVLAFSQLGRDVDKDGFAKGERPWDKPIINEYGVETELWLPTPEPKFPTTVQAKK